MKEVRRIKQHRLYIFDFDFTLFDTYKGQIQCTKAAFAAAGIADISEDDIKRGIGVPLRELFAEHTGDPTVAKLMEHAFLQRSAEVMVELAEPYASTLSVVAELKTRGAKLAIVTGKFRDRVSRILQRFSLAEVFDVIVCGDEIKNDKPDPEGLVKCLTNFDAFGRGESVYVGDHFYDILAAQRCGIDSIAITTGTLSRQELSKFQPTRIIDDLSELL